MVEQKQISDHQFDEIDHIHQGLFRKRPQKKHEATNLLDFLISRWDCKHIYAGSVERTFELNDVKPLFEFLTQGLRLFRT